MLVDFWGVGYTIAERMGILPEVRKRGYAIQELRIVDAQGRKVGGFSTDALARRMNGRFTSLPRGGLAATVYGTIENRIETLFGNSISAIEERASSVLVFFEHGGPREFDIVIGADGLHSTVRELVFGSERQFEKQLGYRIVVFEVEGYRPRDELVFVTYTTPGRQVGRFSSAPTGRCSRSSSPATRSQARSRLMQNGGRPFCTRFSLMPAGNARSYSERWIKLTTCIMIASVKSEWTPGQKDV